MGLPDSVLIGQEVHEAIVEPALNCLFRGYDQVERALGDCEVAGAAIVDDLNGFVVHDRSCESAARQALSRALRDADKLCEGAGLPSNIKKAENALALGRKVAGVDVGGEMLWLRVPQQRL